MRCDILSLILKLYKGMGHFLSAPMLLLSCISAVLVCLLGQGMLLLVHPLVFVTLHFLAGTSNLATSF